MDPSWKEFLHQPSKDQCDGLASYTGFSYSGVACTMSFFFILRQTSKKFFTKENQVVVKNSKCLFFFWEAGEWVSFIALAFDFLWKSAQKVKEIKQNKLY